MNNNINKQICKNCKKFQSDHEDWIATGEFAEYVICKTDDVVDERGTTYRKLFFFEPMDNLEYLEWKDEQSNI